MKKLLFSLTLTALMAFVVAPVVASAATISPVAADPYDPIA